MPTISQPTPNSIDAKAFEEELLTVRQLLQSPADALGMPLGKLVQDQIERSNPIVRAGVVLAVATDDENSERLRRQRVNLAAALEMLYIALNVHKLLLSEEANTADKSLLGGTILAGDFCFSQSASLAIKTKSPAVVDLFSQALKVTSEGNLRHLFDAAPPSFDDSLALCRSGAEAGLTLIDVSLWVGAPLLEGIEQLVQEATAGETVGISDDLAAAASASQRARLTLLAEWLSAADSPLFNPPSHS